MIYARSVFLAVPAAHRVNANKVFAAMDCGPDTFSVAASPSGNDPATHYLAHDASMDATLTDVCLDLPGGGGTLPTITGTWGEDGLPSQGQAKAACATMQIFAATNVDGEVHKASALGGLTLTIIQGEV